MTSCSSQMVCCLRTGSWSILALEGRPAARQLCPACENARRYWGRKNLKRNMMASVQMHGTFYAWRFVAERCVAITYPKAKTKHMIFVELEAAEPGTNIPQLSDCSPMPPKQTNALQIARIVTWRHEVVCAIDRHSFTRGMRASPPQRRGRYE